MFGYPYMNYGVYHFDSTYILVLIGVVLTVAASAKVNATYNKYARVKSISGVTGAEVARRILHNAGLYGVSVEHIPGNLTDHYDPRSKVLRLSDGVYGSTSVAAIGVAAHECGHAIQDQENYMPLKLRSTLVPAANFGSKFSWIIIIAGVAFSAYSTLIPLGILLFSVAVLFQLVTLPVEFNASRRAISILENTGVLYGEELKSTKKVLSAAALTYVAGAAAGVLQLARLVLLFGGRRRD